MTPTADALKGKRQRLACVDVRERTVVIHDGKGGFEVRPRCTKVARCQKWQKHGGVHVI